jgi:hypothetical protein
LRQIAPRRIRLFYQLELPGSLPFFDLLFARDRFDHRAMKLGMDQRVHSI